MESLEKLKSLLLSPAERDKVRVAHKLINPFPKYTSYEERNVWKNRL